LLQTLDVLVQYFFGGLKNVLLQIGDCEMRCDVLAMIDGIARVSAG
tara:strand:+ start:416 stop:553 length:138 start_codon:yes stop_codon:yes gene_type:complete